jgi:hypothetical protein
MTKSERDTINRAWECIKNHTEIGRIFKKDLVPLESYSSNGLVRTATVKDKFSKRVFACGESESEGTYYAVVETTEEWNESERRAMI